MSLKSIRDNYSKLLVAFSDAGIKLTEAQKNDIDQFVLAIESKIDEVKKSSTKIARKIVEEKLDKKYRSVVESVLKNQAKHMELASKIQTRVTRINEAKKLAIQMDKYLDEYLKEALPEKQLVDYERMHKLEKVVESLKDTLMISDDLIMEKAQQLEDKNSKDKIAFESKISDLEKKIERSAKEKASLEKQIDAFKARELLESKTASLPTFEAKQMKARLKGATVEEINSKFKTVLESVEDEMKELAKENEKSLEEEISSIIEGDDTSEDSDKSSKVDSEKTGEEDQDTDSDETTEDEVEDTETPEDTEETETEDEVDESDEDDIVLSESEKIDSDLMQEWIDRARGITPIG